MENTPRFVSTKDITNRKNRRDYVNECKREYPRLIDIENEMIDYLNLCLNYKTIDYVPVYNTLNDIYIKECRRWNTTSKYSKAVEGYFADKFKSKEKVYKDGFFMKKIRKMFGYY